MSKSTGNYINPAELFSGKNDIMSKGFSPGVIRFFMMQAAYRSILDLTNDGLLAAEKGFNRLIDAINLLNNLKSSSSSSIDISAWKQKCYDAMNDDFNTPILIANLFESTKYINQINDGKATITSDDLALLKETINTFTFDILGLENVSKTENNLDKLSGAVELLIKMRQEARANRDFALSDRIRDELAAAGIQLKDSRDGTTFSIN
jgi:cysteinyl-tRNA synthetase